MLVGTVPSYDFIVVGAGTAGCVLAARLSEDPGQTVQLIEAGYRTPLPRASSPPQWPSLMGSAMDWNGRSVPQRANGLTEPLPRGRGLGGSSAINAMTFTRGHRSGYDAWPAVGTVGWDFARMLPYFKRSECASGRNPALRGMEGPLIVSLASAPRPLAEAGLLAAVDAGQLRADDLSGGTDEGFGLCDLNIVAGQRQSSADAYLKPALKDS